MYCDPSDILSVTDQEKLKTILGMVGDGVIPEGQIDDKVLTPYINRASMIMDALLGHIYTLPVTQQAKMMLKPICIALSIAAMFKTAVDYKPPQWVIDDAKEMMDLLRAFAHVGEGKDRLWLPTPAPSTMVGFPSSANNSLKWRVGLTWIDHFSGASPSQQSFYGGIMNNL